MNATLAGLQHVPSRELSKEEQIEVLTAEHRRMDERLKELERQISMTSAEQVEYLRLKKQKLQTKDRLRRLLA